MKIHSVKLQNVRHFQELSLELTRPLTLIGGPNGAGKTTLQESILAAMFFCGKQVRDSFISQYDPDSPPTATLGLSQGEDGPTIFLTRSLLDDQGEWLENGTVFKKKKQALEKVQQVLPISADAAALLLWGRQNDMPAVVNGFPSDGHSLLTAAAIRGSGPDPKEIIKQLEKENDVARKGERGGQVVGPLIQARKLLTALEAELAEARSADDELRGLRRQFQDAKGSRDQLKSQVEAAQGRIRKLSQLDQLLTSALDHIATRDQILEQLAQWEGIDEDIAKARKDVAELQQELDRLTAQHRVARDDELGCAIEALQERIRIGEELAAACASLHDALKATRRPDRSDVEAYQLLQNRLKEAQAKIEATGVRYELSAGEKLRTVRLVEGGQAAREVTLAPGQTHRGIVGRVTIEADGLTFSAAGKEELSGLKETTRKAMDDAAARFSSFQVGTEAEFLERAQEKEDLRKALEQKQTELRCQLSGATLAGLKTELLRVLAARTENNMTLKDREICTGKHLPPASEISAWCAQKRGELHKAREAIRILEEKRPNEATRQVTTKTLDLIRAKARESAAAFKDADESQREPSQPLAKDIRRRLELERREHDQLARGLLEAEKKVAELQGRLKEAHPHRALDAIQGELEEAKEACNREETRQEARALLMKRIDEKMAALAANVPLELGKKVSEHLARLTRGAVGPVVLNQALAVANIGGNGAGAVWRPDQLSHGERHQAALAVKVAVARALAETSGPVFIILDDSLVTFDPQRRAATETFLLDLVNDEMLQVILLTCHTDWAAEWRRRMPQDVDYLDLPQCARYYAGAVGMRTS